MSKRIYCGNPQLSVPIHINIILLCEKSIIRWLPLVGSADSLFCYMERPFLIIFSKSFMPYTQVSIHFDQQKHSSIPLCAKFKQGSSSRRLMHGVRYCSHCLHFRWNWTRARGRRTPSSSGSDIEAPLPALLLHHNGDVRWHTTRLLVDLDSSVVAFSEACFTISFKFIGSIWVLCSISGMEPTFDVCSFGVQLVCVPDQPRVIIFCVTRFTRKGQFTAAAFAHLHTFMRRNWCSFHLCHRVNFH